jgi:hypothetical protein
MSKILVLAALLVALPLVGRIVMWLVAHVFGRAIGQHALSQHLKLPPHLSRRQRLEASGHVNRACAGAQANGFESAGVAPYRNAGARGTVARAPRRVVARGRVRASKAGNWGNRHAVRRRHEPRSLRWPQRVSIRARGIRS